MPAAREPAFEPVRLGAELVHLAEEFYVRLFRVGFAILLTGCALTVWFSTLAAGAPGSTTLLFAAAAAGFGVVGIVRPRSVYLRLRSRPALQLAPAALAAVAVLVDGPDSPCWWIALPLLWITAGLSSTASLAVGAAAVTGLAFLAGTILRGEALLGQQDTGVLPAAVGLAVYTLLGRVLIDAFAGLVLGRHQRVRCRSQHAPAPLRVSNLAASAAPATAPATTTPATRRQPRAATRRQPRAATRLTARQLEVALLLRDGLRQTEIAACLGISVRQVERLVGAARQRVGAATSGQLVAMLASGALASESPRSSNTAADSS